MEKVLKIEATGSELLSFVGYVKEKNAIKALTNIRENYKQLLKRHGDRGSLKVNISTYNPELPYTF